MKTRAALVGALVWALVSTLEAQSSGGSFEVSPFVGYLFGGTLYHHLDPRGVNLEATLEDHVSYGLRVAYAFSNGLEPELEWSGVERDLRVSPLPATLSTRTDFFLAGLAYNFSSSRVRPYAGVAAGVARLSSTIADPEAQFSGRLTLGLKAFVAPWLALRLEAAGYATHLGRATFGFPCTSFVVEEGVAVPVSCSKSWLFDGSLGGGLVFAF